MRAPLVDEVRAMKKIETEIAMRATPEQVWSVLTDFRSYPLWNPFIREASGDVMTGSQLTVRIQPPGGTAMVFRPTIQQASAGQELRWLVHFLISGLFDGEHSFRIEPVGDKDIRFRQSEQFRGVLVPLFPTSIYENPRRGFEAITQAPRERVEGTPAP